MGLIETEFFDTLKYVKIMNQLVSVRLIVWSSTYMFKVAWNLRNHKVSLTNVVMDAKLVFGIKYLYLC